MTTEYTEKRHAVLYRKLKEKNPLAYDKAVKTAFAYSFNNSLDEIQSANLELELVCFALSILNIRIGQ